MKELKLTENKIGSILYAQTVDKLSLESAALGA